MDVKQTVSRKLYLDDQLVLEVSVPKTMSKEQARNVAITLELLAIDLRNKGHFSG